MAIITYPLNNIEYTAEDAELYHATRTSGVFANDDFPITVSGDGNVVTIGEGIGWIRNSKFSGKVVANKAEMSLDLGLPHATYPRIDAVVLQFNANANASEIIVKNGTAQTNPMPPEVVRTESIYELHLYHVYREAGAASVTASNVTDLRSDSAYCGIMSDDVTILGDDYVNKNMVGVSNGVASLDGNGKVPEAQLPSMDYIPISQKAAANGVASLDSSGKVPTSQLGYRNLTGRIFGNFTITEQKCEVRVRSGVCYVNMLLQGTATERMVNTRYKVVGVPIPTNVIASFVDLHGTAHIIRNFTSLTFGVCAWYNADQNTLTVYINHTTEEGEDMNDNLAFSYTCV